MQSTKKKSYCKDQQKEDKIFQELRDKGFQVDFFKDSFMKEDEGA